MKSIPEEIKEYLSYNPDTGYLTYIKSTNNRVKVGDVVSYINNTGYIVVMFKYSMYLAHRIAWFIHTGLQPSGFIDHIDGNPLNNAFTNLREATHNQNQHNRGKPSNNTSGYKGVSWNKNTGKWIAGISLAGKKHHLGLFSTPEEAYSSYCRAAEELHKEYSNYG